LSSFCLINSQVIIISKLSYYISIVYKKKLILSSLDFNVGIMYDVLMTDNNDNEEKKITMYGIWIVDGHPEPIAYFEFVEHAEDWARDNYFGNWLMHEVKLPIKHPLDDLTTEELEKIEENAKMLLAKLKPLPTVEE